MTTLSATLLLLTIMDPLGNVGIFVSALRPVPPERRVRVIARESLIALFIMLVFLFFGRGLLGLLHLTQDALYISGGILLLLIALKMIFPVARSEAEEPLAEPFIVPLAMPMIAGPSVLATLLVMVSSHPEEMNRWLIALIAAWCINSAILLFSPAIARVLTEKGALAMERLMGMLLVMVAVQMFLNGLKFYLKQ